MPEAEKYLWFMATCGSWFKVKDYLLGYRFMEEIAFSDLTLIGRGSNGEVYRYNKLLQPSGLSAVVKISKIGMPKFAIENYNLLRHTGLMNLAFFDECLVDGKPAIMMENLFTDEKVYVSPNSMRNGHGTNLPEAYLLEHKLNDICNIASLLLQMRDVAQCTSGRGIGLDMDMISFGVQRGDKDSPVSYKLVDIDGMLHDDGMYGNRELYENNVIKAKEALRLFISYFIETDEVKKKLLKQVKEFEW